jgi:hypothetical protein
MTKLTESLNVIFLTHLKDVKEVLTFRKDFSITYVCMIYLAGISVSVLVNLQLIYYKYADILLHLYLKNVY